MSWYGSWWLVWRVWKWLFRFFTGKCELQRLCLASGSAALRILRIEQSLRHSRSPALRQVVRGDGVEVEEAVEAIAKQKRIAVASNPQFVERLRPSLVAIRGVRRLCAEVELERRKRYNQDDQEHEKMLMTLWAGLMPGTALEARLSKQWQDVGFQGNNPATDFRGMGLLGLRCLVHFSTQHQAQARSLLSRSHHPQYNYPFAVAGIHMTSRVCVWLREGRLNHFLYSSSPQEPPSLSLFMEVYCYVFVQFDEFWRSSEPESIMQFQIVEEAFSQQLTEQLAATPTSLCMRL